MLHTLLVGLGRSGRELHLPVLRRLRQDAGTGFGNAAPHALFAAATPLGYDLIPLPEGQSVPGLTTVPTLAEARARLDPKTTVIHLCTPPGQRAEVLRDLAELGFSQFLVEKPLGVDSEAVAETRAVRDAYGLRLAVVAPWLHSTLTDRLRRTVRSGRLGELRRITVHQRKPRLRRSLSTPSHPTAFDVELPHSVGVALRLAGGGKITEATWTDATSGDRVVPRMGTAALTLAHDEGATTRIVTDLVSPVRERSIVLDFDAGQAVGHYPISGDDNYAQLRVTPIGLPEEHEVFQDDALDACLLRAYRGFAEHADFTSDFELQAQVVELLESAKQHAAAAEPVTANAVTASAVTASADTAERAVDERRAEAGEQVTSTKNGSIHVG
ncbi:oxidoreductase [Streptomyces zagrosensis]|uniref:Putative dehydrogenase n=1 Tax=Streptomyces zagrosensis TaxID=1042984 RepID=A0A7W9UZP9_9ACTN|nr:oxidoreductase [Streptomyces zagrosensis]MBB5936977.1 putative dehydrogenase [Streptomyces zagrosensis]